MRWSSVLASHEAGVGGYSRATGVSTREGVRDGVSATVWLEAKGKKKYLSQFFSWVVPAAIETAAGWLMCPREACEGRCDGVTGVPAKGGGATTPWLASFLHAVEASMGREEMVRIQRGWLSGALSHATY